MSAHTLIASRDPFEGDSFVHDVALRLARHGDDVALFLVENGVFLARAGAATELLASLTEAGVTVFADSFALSERGIADGRLADGVTATGLETLVDHLAAGRKTSWH